MWYVVAVTMVGGVSSICFCALLTGQRSRARKNGARQELRSVGQ